MKNLKALPTLFSIVLVILSCSKGNEHLSRDLLSAPTPVMFEMPANTGSNTSKKLTEFPYHIDLDSLIHANTGSSFQSADIKSIRLASMRLDVVAFDTTYNFRLIDSLQVKVRNGLDTTAILSQVISNPDVNMETLMLPMAGNQPELKNFINNGELIYLLSGRIRRITTAPFKATLTAQYRITIGK